MSTVKTTTRSTEKPQYLHNPLASVLDLVSQRSRKHLLELTCSRAPQQAASSNLRFKQVGLFVLAIAAGASTDYLRALAK